MYDKAMDERRSKAGILGSLTWKGDSTKGAHKGTKKKSQRMGEGRYRQGQSSPSGNGRLRQ